MRPPAEPPGISRRALLLSLFGAVFGALVMLGAAATTTEHTPERPPGPEVTLAVTP